MCLLVYWHSKAGYQTYVGFNPENFIIKVIVRRYFGSLHAVNFSIVSQTIFIIQQIFIKKCASQTILKYCLDKSLL